MTLGGVARVAMEYRQHLAMLTNISKLSSAMDGGGGGKMMLSNNGGANCNGGNGGDTFTCEFFKTLSCLLSFPVSPRHCFQKAFSSQLTAATVRLLLLLLMFNSFEFFNFNFSLYRIAADDNC